MILDLKYYRKLPGQADFDVVALQVTSENLESISKDLFANNPSRVDAVTDLSSYGYLLFREVEEEISPTGFVFEAYDFISESAFRAKYSLAGVVNIANKLQHYYLYSHIGERYLE